MHFFVSKFLAKPILVWFGEPFRHYSAMTSRPGIRVGEIFVNQLWFNRVGLVEEYFI